MANKSARKAMILAAQSGCGARNSQDLAKECGLQTTVTTQQPVQQAQAKAPAYVAR